MQLQNNRLSQKQNTLFFMKFKAQWKFYVSELVLNSYYY